MHLSTDFAKTIVPTTCLHQSIRAKDDGSFAGIEEMKLAGSDWVIRGLTGKVSGDKVSIDFFDDAVTKKVQVLDTDYDNFVIGVECYDN